MRNPRSLPMLALAALLVPWSVSPSTASDEAIAIEIRASPQHIVLSATRTGDWITVHAEIPYADVDLDSPLTLNNIAVDVAKPDNRGDLVAKVHLANLRETVSPPFTILILEGYTAEGELFAGSCTVAVRE